jgi:hypothetical protein
MAGLLGTKDERAALELTDAANRLLGNGHNAPPGFVGLLFARVVPEDLIGYTPDELAARGRRCGISGHTAAGRTKDKFESPSAPRVNGLARSPSSRSSTTTCRFSSIP